MILTYQNRAMGEEPFNVVPTLYVGSDGKLRGKFNSPGEPITTANPVTDNAWHHVVLSGARDTTAMFLDGAKVGTTAGEIDHVNMDRAYLGGGYTGVWPGGNGGWSWFTGQIDEAAVYDYPLTDQSVAEHYALRTGSAQLTRTTLPSGRTSAQIAYDPVSERVTTVKDSAGTDWTISKPSFTGGSFLYSNAVKGSTPVGYWRLGERDGAIAASSVGDGAAGTYGDGVAKRAPGVFASTDDTAACFDAGAASQIEIPQHLIHDKTELAVELWFNTTGPGVLMGDQSHPIDTPGGPTGQWTPILYVGADGKLRGRFYGSATDSPSSANTVTDGAWHHVVLSVEGTAQTLYLDGQSVGVQQGTVDHQTNVHTYLGAGFAKYWPSSPGDVSRFAGSIDEAAVYQHPLGAAEVLAHYRARNAQVAGQGAGYRGSVVADSPAGFWRLDESAGTAAASEVAAIKGGGTLAPAVKAGTTGVFGPGDGRAAEFNGTGSSYIDLPTPILQAKSELAAELWFRTSAPGVLLSLQSEPMGAAPFNVTPSLYVGSDGKLRGKFYNGTNGVLTSPGSVQDGSWHHVVLSADQSGQSLYLDGTLVATEAGTVSHLNMNRTYLGGGYTGSWPGGNGGWSWLTGSIDEVTFYQHPLSAERIAAHYQARSQSTAAEVASLVTLTDPDGNTSTDVHDVTRGNRLISRTDAAGETTSYTYDVGGFVHNVIDPNGHSTVSGQDARGNTVSLTTCRDKNSCWTSYTSYFLNKDNPRDPRNDKPTETRDARSTGPGDNTYRTTVTYNAVGRPESTTRPDGRTTRTTYTTGSEPGMNGGTMPPGLLASETTAGGATTTYLYNLNGDLALTKLPSGLRLRHTYDAAGNKTSTTETSDSQPAGVTTTYTYDASNRLVTTTGPKTADTVSGTEHQTRVTLTYDQDGRVTSEAATDIVGPDGTRTTTTTYDSAGRLESETDAEGAVTRYGYDNLSRVVTVTDPLGQVTRSTYTPRSQLATTVVEGWNGDGAAPRDLTFESRAYDPAGRLASVTDAMGATTSYTYFDDGLPATIKADSVTQADGTTRSIVLEANEYDGAGHLIKRTTGGGRTTVVNTVDTAGRVTQSVLDPGGLGRTTTATYDVDDRVTSTTLKVSDSENSVQTSTYDGAGRLTRSQLSSSAGGPAAVSTFTYDQRGLLLTSTTPNGNAAGADPAAHTTNYQYDNLGRPTTTTAPQAQVENTGGTATPIRPAGTVGYNAFGEAVSVKDPLGRITVTTVDKLGRATETRLPDYTPPGSTTPLNAKSKTEYDKLSRVVAASDTAGRRTTFAYDRLGHQVQRVAPNSLGYLEPSTDNDPPTWAATWTPTGLPLSTTDPVGARTEATYDQLGRTLTATIVERKPTLQNLTTKFTWDDAGNQTALTTPAGHTSTATYNTAGQPLTTTDPLARTVRYDYDGLGRTVKTTAPLGDAVRTRFDSLGNPTATDDLDPAGTVLRTTTAAFDLEGRVVSTTSPATGAVTTVQYDALGNAVKLTEPVSAGQAITTTFGYDATGNRTRLTDGRGNTTTYTFNPWGLPESTIEPATAAHPAAADRTWTTTYDAAGQPTTSTEPGGVVRTRTYDPSGRLTQETGTGAEASTTTRTLKYSKAGRLTSASNGTFLGQTYSYNDRGLPISAAPNLSASTQTWEYDNDGNLTRRWDKDTDATTYGYHADGQPSWATNPQTKTTNWYAYDGNGRLSKQSYVAPDPANPAVEKALSERHLSYDGLGRLAGDQVLTGAGLSTPLTGTAYEYDLDNRLTRKTVSWSATDPVTDNRYGYDQAGRLTSWTTGPVTTAYEWDAAGNRTKNADATATYDERNRLLTDATSTYRYTARGTLAAVTTAGTETARTSDAFDRVITEGAITYTYDGLDRVRTRNAITFTYDGTSNNLTGDGTWRYARDANGALLSATDGTNSHRVRTDQHTDATATLNPDGTALSGTTTYDPFGKPVATTGTRTSLGYQSGWTDPATGDVNMHARWYRPGTGGFTARDSWQLDPNPSVQANRYTYANASPLNGTDPTGHDNISHVGGGGGYSIGTPAAGGSGQFSPGSSGFNGTITIPRPAPQAPAPKAPPAPYTPNVSGYRAPNAPNAGAQSGFSIAGANAVGFSGIGNPSTAPSGYAGSDVYQEKREARDRWRGTSQASSSQSLTGQPVTGSPASSGAPQKPSCHTCRGAKKPPRPTTPKAEPPKPLFDKAKPYVERPALQSNWSAPDPRSALDIITASYTSADLLAMLVLVPNALPSTAAAPGAQPGSGPDPSKAPNCLARKPAGSDTDRKDGTGVGWIMYGDMEDVVGSPGVKRPTTAEACLVGKPNANRGTGAGGDIAGWAEARTIAQNGGITLTNNTLARCHFIAREFGGRGKAQNLAPCFQTGVNTKGTSMRSFEVMVGNAMNDKNNPQVVDYTVSPVYKSPSSTIPMGFFMVAIGHGRNGSIGLREFAYVGNEKARPDGVMVQLGN